MAKLTESYLRGMIKQVMNEMQDRYESGYGIEGDFNYGLEAGYGDMVKPGFRDLEEMADELGLPVGEIESIALKLGHQIQTHGGRKLIKLKDDGLSESKAPKRR
jgi:hypothetical protein